MQLGILMGARALHLDIARTDARLHGFEGALQGDHDRVAAPLRP
jgi:hypothetical protein